MKNIILLLMIFSSELIAQTKYGSISGFIIDEQTKQPIENVNAYIANSLTRSSSNKEGNFHIGNISPGRYTLILSHLSYENQNLKIDINSNEVVELNIKLAPKPIEFPEIGVGDKFDDEWWKNFEIFQAELLGKTWFAEGCQITNPYYIDFFKNNDGVLFASCDVPIQIENRSLGYNVKYTLKHFEYKFGSLKYAGLPFFEEMQSDFEDDYVIWQNNRLEAYMGSLRHFLRTLATSYRLIKQNREKVKLLIDLDDKTEIGVRFFYDAKMFMSKNGFEAYTPDLIFGQFGAQSISKPLYPDSVIADSERPNELILNCRTQIYVIYNKEYQKLNYKPQYSFIKPHADSIYFDKGGKYFDELKLETTGYFGIQRLAEMLPFEYEPSDSLIINTDFR
ncbi:MAG: carboxypeptidase-like regulatory domain-containing protein [Melioribacteraceae bacterium]|jgi:hypothetical protein|nr:MAG: carboxypeptidase-like regulatory domain-containing protein [Ignavibacteriales bacterium]WKZ69504.1 MAG: carboxypeptidase-like regulatory domain-containing protein [Melioribacteraceae bacterium]